MLVDLVVITATLLSIIGYYKQNKWVYYLSNAVIWVSIGLAIYNSDMSIVTAGFNLQAFQKNWTYALLFIILSYNGALVNSVFVKKEFVGSNKKWYEFLLYVYNATILPFVVYFCPVFIGLLGVSLIFNNRFYDDVEVEVGESYGY